VWVGQEVILLFCFLFGYCMCNDLHLSQEINKVDAPRKVQGVCHGQIRLRSLKRQNIRIWGTENALAVSARLDSLRRRTILLSMPLACQRSTWWRPAAFLSTVRLRLKVSSGINEPRCTMSPPWGVGIFSSVVIIKMWTG